MRCEAVYLFCSVYGCYLLVGFPKCGAEEGKPLLVQVVLAVAAAQAPLTGGGGAGHPRQGALLTYLTSYTQALYVGIIIHIPYNHTLPSSRQLPLGVKEEDGNTTLVCGLFWGKKRVPLSLEKWGEGGTC